MFWTAPVSARAAPERATDSRLESMQSQRFPLWPGMSRGALQPGWTWSGLAAESALLSLKAQGGSEEKGPHEIH